MKNWNANMWTGVFALAFALLGPTINYWVLHSFAIEMLYSLFITIITLYVLFKNVQTSFTLTFYGGLVGVILLYISSATALSALIWITALFAFLFFIPFTILWSAMDKKLPSQ